MITVDSTGPDRFGRCGDREPDCRGGSRAGYCPLRRAAYPHHRPQRTHAPAGFIDSHSHVEGLATSEHFLVPIQSPPLKDAAEIIAKLKERARQLPPGTWIVGQGTYNQVMPTREELDRELPQHPVVLRWSAATICSINHMANEMAGLGRGTPDSKGMGRIERARNGEPAILRDAGVELPLPHATFEQMREWIPLTLRDFYLARGVTTVYDMSSPSIGYEIYRELASRAQLPVRLRYQLHRRPRRLEWLEGRHARCVAETICGPSRVTTGSASVR